jgi:hypothetical protein
MSGGEVRSGPKTGSAGGTSVLPLTADIGTPTAQVRFVPILLQKSVETGREA